MPDNIDSPVIKDEGCVGKYRKFRVSGDLWLRLCRTA